MAPLKYWVWLSSCVGVAALTKNRLLAQYGSPEQVYFADEESYRGLDWLKKSELTGLLDKSLVPAKRALDVCAENGWRVLTLSDGEYPSRLRNIPDPPLVLYVRGRLPVVDEEAVISVVGTRSCTPYGLKAAERLAYELTRDGCLVVTGLARGIDSAAAYGALRAGGRVVGVLGSGVDIVYPPENGKLFDDVAGMGAIVSEYPPGTTVAPAHFPQRNRIMSGLSVGVLVIEAPLKSGALITATHALEQGRDVFALPGNVDSPSFEGSHQLLREGAVIVTCGDDIAEEYEALFPDKVRIASTKIPLDPALSKKLTDGAVPEKRQNTTKKEIDNEISVEYIDLVQLKEHLGEAEMKIVSAIGAGTRHIDEIISTSGMSTAETLSTLTMLELDGYVEQLKGKLFRLAASHSRT